MERQDVHLQEIACLAQLVKIGLECIHLAIDDSALSGLVLKIGLQFHPRLLQSGHTRLKQLVVFHKSAVHHLMTLGFALKLFMQPALLVEHDDGLVKRINRLLLELNLLQAARVVLVVLVVRLGARQVFSVDIF